MDIQTILNKITELRKTGKFDDEQLKIIKLACYNPEFDETLLMDPSISSDKMLAYIELSKFKVDVRPYIEGKWHLKKMSANQLYTTIFHEEVELKKQSKSIK